ncbi:GNAT family N-acetyltransferase [Devosia rhizoryzae]|uniref:GNAT family N-acetyltransferase n=1 Tax=Devosia rhizoryzae TaxID=2774137 RepID=A0ABX7C968_9HYPH|nr:GNAT family N-acetyltransferase [Devosia rhizoryzae]QQR39252.1 GNAT family N-acetyltransferase [Devosia rhizoryzae]
MTRIETSRLVLRAPRPDDAPCIALGMGEFEVARWLAPVPWPYTLAMAIDWVRMAPENGLFVVDLPGRGLIGCVVLGAELGFWIGRPHWGRGYATEAASAVLDWYFRTSDEPEISSIAHHANKSSLRVKAKLGFVETGRDRRFSHALGHNVEHVVSTLTRADWLAGEAKRCA